jgi:DNA polymerase/3'-5' exonuclease PolX
MDFYENKKDTIIKELETMSKKEAIEKNFFKVRAYKKVIDQLKSKESIKSMDDVAGIEGIGVKIKAKIEEILTTGKLKSAEKARIIQQNGVNKLELYDELLKIHGIGIVKAQDLVNNFDVRSIDDLRKALQTNQELLNDTQKIGLKYYLDTQQKIPREEMDKHAKKIRKLTKDIDHDLEIKIVGSYRRNAPESGDIDLLVTINRETDSSTRSKMLDKIIDTLKSSKPPYIVAELASGKKKFMGMCQLKKNATVRRLDILMTDKKEYPFALLYFTGDFDINIAMRKKASELGYTLSEYGLNPNSNDIPTIELNSEREIFKFLGFKYLQPKDRNIQKLKELK